MSKGMGDLEPASLPKENIPGGEASGTQDDVPAHTNTPCMDFLSWVLVIYSLTLFGLAVIHPVGVVIQQGNLQLKLHHVAALAVHVVLLWWWIGPRAYPLLRRLLLAGGVTFLFGGFIELVQLFLAHRSGQVSDLLQNLIGVLVGSGAIVLGKTVATWYRKRRERRVEPHY